MFLNVSCCELQLLARDPCGKRPMIELRAASATKDAPVPIGALAIVFSVDPTFHAHSKLSFKSKERIRRSGILAMVVEKYIGL